MAFPSVVVIDVEDDCIGMKGGNNWLVEDLNASGAGLSVGTLSWGRPVSNVTFRNIRMCAEPTRPNRRDAESMARRGPGCVACVGWPAIRFTPAGSRRFGRSTSSPSFTV